MGFRAPAVAALLFGASLAVAAWALLAAGALGVYGPIGLTVHRRGLLLIGAGLVLLPLVTGRVRHPELDVPCWLAAAVLVRIGMVRWGGLEEPDRAAVPAATPTATATATPTAVPRTGRARGGNRAPAPQAARVAGRLTGRAGTVLGREAAAALPRAARAAGRAIGHTRHQRPRP